MTLSHGTRKERKCIQATGDRAPKGRLSADDPEKQKHQKVVYVVGHARSARKKKSNQRKRVGFGGGKKLALGGKKG